MNRAQIAEYKDNGFIVLKNLIPEYHCQQVLKDIHSIARFQLSRFIQLELEDNRLGNVEHIHEELQMLLSYDQQAYLSFARRSAKLIKLHEYLSHKEIQSVLSSLNFELPTIVTEPILHISSDKLIIPNGYAGFKTHQDWPSIQGSLDCVVVWAPLVKVTKNNFPLQVIPQSHLRGIYSGVVKENLLEIDQDLYDKNQYLSVEAEPGDVVIMSSWMLHQTGVNNSTGFRLSCSTRYDNSAESTFIQRGYPCAYKRSVERELITNNFPKKNQIKNLFSN